MPENDAAHPLSPSEHLLVLTGQRGTERQRRRFHRAFFCGRRVSLTNGPFVLLSELARARIGTHTGYLLPTPQTEPEAFRLAIHRLRRHIDTYLALGEGMQWIETGVGTEYRITVHATDIAVDESFKELPWQLLSADLRDFLVEKCPEVSVEQIHAAGLKVL